MYALLLTPLLAIMTPTPAPAPIQTFEAQGNPVFKAADPHAVVIENTLWIYPTGSHEADVRGFWAYASEDLIHWRLYGPVLDYADVDWINELDRRTQTRRFAWAPGVAIEDDRVMFYYSAGPQHHPVPSHIGVAQGTEPTGPFTDHGEALIIGEIDAFEAIDPMLFTDPADGRHYLYVGGSAPGVLRVYELDDTLMNIMREVDVEQPEQFTEGPFMHERNGRYYMTYSHGRWWDSSYSVHAAEADSPTGPWQYMGPILTSDRRHKGPGHHSIIQSPHNDAWFIVYHRWNNRRGEGSYRGGRSVAIDRLHYDADGHIEPIQMTDRGVAEQWRQ